MIPPYIRGPIANVFTAFHADGRFDETGQRNFLDFLRSTHAISAYFVRSGMGQMYTYSLDDVHAMTRLAISHLAGEAPVLVGCAGIWNGDYAERPDPAAFVRESVELSRFAQDHGAAGVVHTLPEAIAPGSGETIGDVTLAYFEAINAAVSIPIFIYQPPRIRPEYRLTVDVARELAGMDNVIAVKVSTDSAQVLLDIVWATRDAEFTVIAGNECAYYSALGMGCTGVIGQGCCVNPQILKAELERYEAGDFRGAMDAQRAVNRLVQESVQPVAFLKRYATERGFPVQSYAREEAGAGYGRAVVTPDLSDNEYQTYKRILESELARFA